MSNKLRRLQRHLMKQSGVELVPTIVRDDDGREKTEYRYPLVTGVGVRANDGRPVGYEKPARKPWQRKERSTIVSAPGTARKGEDRDRLCRGLPATASKELHKALHAAKMQFKRNRSQGHVDNSVRITKNADPVYRKDTGADERRFLNIKLPRSKKVA